WAGGALRRRSLPSTFRSGAPASGEQPEQAGGQDEDEQDADDPRERAAEGLGADGGDPVVGQGAADLVLAGLLEGAFAAADLALGVGPAAFEHDRFEAVGRGGGEQGDESAQDEGEDGARQYES